MTTPISSGGNVAVTPGKISKLRVVGICILPWIAPGLLYLAGVQGIGWVIVLCAPPLTAFAFAIARPQWSLLDSVVRLPRFPFRTRRIPVSHIISIHGHLTKPGTGKEWAQYDLILIDGMREMVARQYLGNAEARNLQMKMASAAQRSGAMLLATELGIPFAEDENVVSKLPRGSSPVITASS